MSFRVGSHVVHPHHGVALIERREKREMGGESREYLVLRVDSQDLDVFVPAASAETLGLRALISQDEGHEILETLTRPARMPKSWARRFKNHTEKLRSGDLHEKIVVLRNLWVLSEQRTLSPGEQKMLARVRDLVLPELGLVFGEDRDDVELRLSAVMAQRSSAHDLAS
jgi:CarD family transcriptional regulator